MNLSAVLLAGGESRRMGREKATLPWKGCPLWRHQLDLLRRLQPNEILISARADPPWRPADAIFAADKTPSRGPLSGLSAALALSRSPHLLVLAIDLPLMTERYLRSLWDQSQPGRGVLPILFERAEPLAAIYPREASVVFETALQGADFSLQTVTRKLVETGRLRVVPVAPEDAPCFRNMNEPGDLAE